MKLRIGSIVAAVAFGSAHAAVTYIDADSTPGTGNTVLDGAGSIVTGANATQSSSDGIWSTRPRAVNGGTVLVGAEGESASPRLITTFDLPAPGVYNIFGFFYINNQGVLSGSPQTGGWDAEFQLGNGGAQTVYSAGVGNAANLSANAAYFDNPAVIRAEGSIHLHEAALGTWDTSTNGTTVTVYIYDNDGVTTDGSATANDDRTWYDGVGYEVVPEPASLALLGIGGLCLRRRRC